MSTNHPLYTAAAAKAVAERMSDALSTSNVYARQIHNEVAKLATSAEALAAVFDSHSPTETTAAHQKKVATAAKSFAAQVTASRDRMQASVHEGSRDVEQRFRETTGFKANEYAREIRAAVRALPMDGKLSLLSDLADRGNGAELAAIIDAPTLLTGIPDDAPGRFRTQLEVKHAPAEYADRKALTEAFIAGFDLAKLCAGLASSLSDPAGLAAIERGEQAAAAALSAFQEAANA